MRAEPIKSRMYDFGLVELTLDSRGFWLWRIPDAGPALREFSALGYRTPDDAYRAAALRIRGVSSLDGAV